MKIVDNLVAGFAPQFAIKRIQARLAIKAFYEAAQTTRLHKKRSDTRDADGVNENSAIRLRIQARHLTENLDLAKGALDVLVDNVVGQGLRPEPMVKLINGEFATEVNETLLHYWKDWIQSPEVTFELDYYSAQRLQAATWFRDGECLTQFLIGNVPGLDHGTVVPFSLELLEPDFLPFDFNDASKGIIQGVQKNTFGRPRNYHVYKVHPGTTTGVILLQDTKRIPAERMIHIKSIDRIGQTRGITKFASVINRLDDIKEIEESERVAARVAAAMSGFIKKGSPDLYIPSTDSEPREMDFQPGMIFDDLMIGEEIQSVISNRPNNAIVDFRASQLRAAASGFGISYSSYSRDYNGSYSAQRQELLEAHIHYGVLWHYFCEVNARPTYRQFVTSAVGAGLIPVGVLVDVDTLYDVDFSQPVMPWVDPQKEINALAKAIEIKIKSRSAAIRERGGNPDEVFKQIQKEDEIFPPQSNAPQDNNDNNNNDNNKNTDDDADTVEAREFLKAVINQ